jgi:lipopolysaccharide transport system ATP-binding protein
MNWPVRGGGVYPTVYVTKQQFDRVRLPGSSRHFVVIRDLRDTLVSAYFSFKVSHPIEESGLAQVRETLQSVSAEEGLLHLIREWLPRCANIQATWLESGERLIRYEDLLDHDVEILEPLLLDHCRLPIGSDVLRETVRRNRFESLTKNRARGQEDATVHERKGIAGDWRNHFTEPVKKAFKLRYGPLLLATGYERSSDW